MPSHKHEILLDLLRGRPSFAPELVRDVLHAPLPAFESVHVGEATLTQLTPTEYRADLVLVLDGSDETPAAALVIEVQLAEKEIKRWTWPVYLAGLRARLRCPVVLVVVTPDTAVAAWAAQPIDLGHPGLSLTPLVLGPGTVPIIRSKRHALRSPELALLSALVHVQGTEALAVAKAALAVVARLDEDQATLYTDQLLAQVPEAVRVILEKIMSIPDYEFQSDFFKRRIAQRLAESKAEDLLAVLTARGLHVPASLRERILACADHAQLHAWLVRAATATTASEVVADQPGV